MSKNRLTRGRKPLAVNQATHGAADAITPTNALRIRAPRSMRFFFPVHSSVGLGSKSRSHSSFYRLGYLAFWLCFGKPFDKFLDMSAIPDAFHFVFEEGWNAAKDDCTLAGQSKCAMGLARNVALVAAISLPPKAKMVLVNFLPDAPVDKRLARRSPSKRGGHA